MVTLMHALKLVLATALVAFGVLALIVIVLIVLNGRDPYGGPIEPSTPH